MNFKYLRSLLILFIACLSLEFSPAAQPATNDPTNAANSGTPEERLAVLQLERTNAWQSVLKIVNQPVRAFARTANMRVSTYTEGWFHPGATKPDFNTVDVRQSQELPYDRYPYVTSDLNPGIVFIGPELEFNAMTKYFYTNRSLPKHKLTEAEMLEINRLYRIIGRCEKEIVRLQTPAGTTPSAETAEGDAEAVAANQPLARIRSIPQETRILYGGIAIGALILICVLLRLIRKRRG